MTFAIVLNETVENIIESDYYNACNVAELIGGTAIDCNNYGVSIGCEYKNGAFYRSGYIVERALSEKEQIVKLESAVDSIIISLLGV